MEILETKQKFQGWTRRKEGRKVGQTEAGKERGRKEDTGVTERKYMMI